MEEKKIKKKSRQNRSMLIVIALVVLAAAGAFFTADRFILREGTGSAEKGSSPLVSAEPIARPVTDDHGYVDKPIDASSNLHLDIRREASAEPTVEEQLADRQVYFSGVGDETLAYDTEISLDNLPENEDFMMKYVITDLDSGENVFETGLIPSGECVKWIPGHSLGEGEHHLNFHIAPYYPQGDQYLPLTSANNEVTFTIGGM